MYLVRIGYPIFKSELQEFNKPDRSGRPRFFTGPNANSHKVTPSERRYR